jgi:hypothetical protein
MKHGRRGSVVSFTAFLHCVADIGPRPSSGPRAFKRPSFPWQCSDRGSRLYCDTQATLDSTAEQRGVSRASEPK